MLTSKRIIDLTSLIALSKALSADGIKTLKSGWRTFILVFLRKLNIKEETFCAKPILYSKSLLISF